MSNRPKRRTLDFHPPRTMFNKGLEHLFVHHVARPWRRLSSLVVCSRHKPKYHSNSCARLYVHHRKPKYHSGSYEHRYVHPRRPKCHLDFDGRQYVHPRRPKCHLDFDEHLYVRHHKPKCHLGSCGHLCAHSHFQLITFTKPLSIAAYNALALSCTKQRQPLAPGTGALTTRTVARASRALCTRLGVALWDKAGHSTSVEIDWARLFGVGSTPLLHSESQSEQGKKVVTIRPTRYEEEGLTGPSS